MTISVLNSSPTMSKFKQPEVELTLGGDHGDDDGGGGAGALHEDRGQDADHEARHGVLQQLAVREYATYTIKEEKCLIIVPLLVL